MAMMVVAVVVVVVVVEVTVIGVTSVLPESNSRPLDK